MKTILWLAALMVCCGALKAQSGPEIELQCPPGTPIQSGSNDTNWPPLYAADGDSGSGDYSVITRDDGKKQWAFKGKPLYYWTKDQKPGDRTGDGFLNNAWHVAKP